MNNQWVSPTCDHLSIRKPRMARISVEIHGLPQSVDFGAPCRARDLAVTIDSLVWTPESRAGRGPSMWCSHRCIFQPTWKVAPSEPNHRSPGSDLNVRLMSLMFSILLSVYGGLLPFSRSNVAQIVADGPLFKPELKDPIASSRTSDLLCKCKTFAGVTSFLKYRLSSGEIGLARCMDSRIHILLRCSRWST